MTSMYGRSLPPASVHCWEHPTSTVLEDSHAGDLICSECGLVLGDRVIDMGAEWRNFSEGATDKSRIGYAEDPSLTTALGSTLILNDRHCPRDEMGHLLYKNAQVTTSISNLMSAYREMAEITERLNLPRIILDEAKGVYRKIHESGGVKRGKAKRTAQVCAVLFVVCSNNEASRTVNEFCWASGCQKNDVASILSTIPGYINQPRRLAPEDYVERQGQRLQLAKGVVNLSKHIARKAADLFNKAPQTIAAASILMATRLDNVHPPKVYNITEAAAISPPVLTNTYMLFKSRAAEVLPPEFSSLDLTACLPDFKLKNGSNDVVEK